MELIEPTITKFNNTTPPKPKSIEELKNNDQKQTK